MAAGVVEGAQCALPVAHDEDRIVADLRRDVVARPRHLAIVTDEQPLLVEDVVEIELVDLGIDIERARQRVALPPALEGHQGFVVRAHVRPASTLCAKKRMDPLPGRLPCRFCRRRNYAARAASDNRGAPLESREGRLIFA